ncbi:MAG: hypothetical protein QOF02_3202 [Blastocatellia bacterium]|jgi:uncharacterized protein YicC (UPF0701 family)|nr:hypothetical protein [Blastocatellia bacterium]
MPKVSVDNALADGEQIARVWAENPTFTLGEITQESLQELLTELRTTRAETEELRTKLTARLNKIEELIEEVKLLVTRARSGFRATFGPDSTQYEQSGGTRTSERKRPGSGDDKKDE